MRVHAISPGGGLRQREGDGIVFAVMRARTAYWLPCGQQAAQMVVSAHQEAVDEAVQVVDEDRRVAIGFLRTPWLPLDAFVRLGGPALMLELVLASPGERCEVYVDACGTNFMKNCCLAQW